MRNLQSPPKRPKRSEALTRSCGAQPMAPQSASTPPAFASLIALFRAICRMGGRTSLARNVRGQGMNWCLL